MSKTDKTLPLHVKLKNGDLAWEEFHDHTDGPCDLGSADDLDTYGWTSWGTRRCYRTFFYTGTHICCCTHCHGDWVWDLPPGKRQRIESKRMCRDWEREYDESWEDSTFWVGADDDWYDWEERDTLGSSLLGRNGG